MAQLQFDVRAKLLVERHRPRVQPVRGRIGEQDAGLPVGHDNGLGGVLNDRLQPCLFRCQARQDLLALGDVMPDQDGPRTAPICHKGRCRGSKRHRSAQGIDQGERLALRLEPALCPHGRIFFSGIWAPVGMADRDAAFDLAPSHARGLKAKDSGGGRVGAKYHKISAKDGHRIGHGGKDRIQLIGAALGIRSGLDVLQGRGGQRGKLHKQCLLLDTERAALRVTD